MRLPPWLVRICGAPFNLLLGDAALAHVLDLLPLIGLGVATEAQRIFQADLFEDIIAHT